MAAPSSPSPSQPAPPTQSQSQSKPDSTLDTTNKPCKRCKDPDAPYKLRNSPTCRKCYADYIETKLAKRLGFLHKEVRTSSLPEPRRYVAGLSFGPSSSALVHLLDDYAKLHSGKKSSSSFDVLVVHIDTNLNLNDNDDDETLTPAQKLTATYKEKYPFLSFTCLHISQVLQVKTINWRTLPPQGTHPSPTHRLRDMLSNLPSATSRADVLRLLTRHLLLHAAIERDSHYSALLLGHTTTALAALTLSEVANGRGHSVAWNVNDGPYTICTYHNDGDDDDKEQAQSITAFPIHYPLREIFKGEIATYISLTPSLTELNLLHSEGLASTVAVVSHRDTSIEDVMARYFSGVEEPLSGIVANVVRTTGKLDRAGAAGVAQQLCGLCGVVLNERGDSRWAGDMGEEVGSGDGRLCYGCKRSVNG